MARKSVALFGINVDQRDTSETIEFILETIENYNERQGSKEIQSLKATPSYVATLNIDFLAHALSFGWNSPRYVELLKVLRNSNVVTPDGMPIVFIAKLLGSPLPERVTGADLVPALAEALGFLKKTIFLLGGSKKVNAEAKALLEEINPGLEVVGVYAPLVMTEGIGILEATERDTLILEEIHRTRPDVLLISLGHPKQEVWFERVRDQLRVPVAIGIGGALNFLTGHVKRAPKWMQSIGLEWAYRIYAEPKKLWIRYLYDALFFLYLAAPLCFYHKFNSFAVQLANKALIEDPKDNLLFLSEKSAVAVVRIPKILDAKNVRVVRGYIDEAFLQDVVVIDFQNARHMDLEGLSLILTLWKRAKRANKALLAFKVNISLALFFRLHRVWDILSDDICKSANSLCHRLFQGRNRSSLYETYHQDGETITISYLGSLERNHEYDRLIEQMEPMLFLKDCRVDLTYCNLIDNKGFFFLLKLRQFVEGNGKKFKIGGVSKELAVQFKIVRLFEEFIIE